MLNLQHGHSNSSPESSQAALCSDAYQVRTVHVNRQIETDQSEIVNYSSQPALKPSQLKVTLAVIHKVALVGERLVNDTIVSLVDQTLCVTLTGYTGNAVTDRQQPLALS